MTPWCPPQPRRPHAHEDPAHVALVGAPRRVAARARGGRTSPGGQKNLLTWVDDRSGESIEVDHPLDGDPRVDLRAGAYGDAPERVVRPHHHRLRSAGHA